MFSKITRHRRLESNFSSPFALGRNYFAPKFLIGGGPRARRARVFLQSDYLPAGSGSRLCSLQKIINVTVFLPVATPNTWIVP